MSEDPKTQESAVKRRLLDLVDELFPRDQSWRMSQLVIAIAEEIELSTKKTE